MSYLIELFSQLTQSLGLSLIQASDQQWVVIPEWELLVFVLMLGLIFAMLQAKRKRTELARQELHSRFAHFNGQFPGLHFNPLVDCRRESDQP